MKELQAKWQLPLALFLIAVITLALYFPVLSHGFIDYDDNEYVTVNMMVRQGITMKGFFWAFSAFHAGNWHPLTWLSHMADVQLFDLKPAGHHAVSILFHIANTILLFLLLRKLTGLLWRSAIVALLFAVHPLHVESVAWVSERKDVLSTLFWILTMWCYAEYARERKLPYYLAAVACFVLGLLSKQMVVTVPVVLLLMDFWPLNRFPERGWKTLLVEKVPFFALSAAASLVTVAAQKSGGALGHGNSPLVNSGNALLSYVRYIGHMLWPSDLALFYPFDSAAVTAPKVAGAAVILIVVTAAVILQRKERPFLLFGWLWYLVTLLPVIGFLRAGDQAMADRYTYVPLIGLFVLLVWGIGDLARSWSKGPMAAAGAAAVVVAALSVVTTVQIGYWKSSYDLFGHALAVVPDNWLAHNNMGILLARQYRPDQALRHFQESVRLNPEGVVGLTNLATAYQALGAMPQAIEAYRQALRLAPEDVETHYRLGYAYLLSGNRELAYQEYQQLMQLHDEAHAAPLLDSIKMGR